MMLASTIFLKVMREWRSRSNIFSRTLLRIYARSFLEGRLTEKDLDNFRREVDKPGISSYPHPWLMPDYWQFPTVSRNLGPIMGIYQAHDEVFICKRPY